MAAIVEFTWDSRELEIWRSRKVDHALASALKKAGSTALRDMKAASTRSVRIRKRFKVKRVNEALPLFYPHGDNIGELIWRMDVRGEIQPVSAFSVKQQRQGVAALINKGRVSKLRGAFIATMRSGHTGVFYRTGKARLPIKETFSTRISDVFRDEGMIPAVQAVTERTFYSGIQRLMELELSKIK